MRELTASEKISSKWVQNYLTTEEKLLANLVASWIIHQLVRAGVQRLTGVHWVQNHFVSDHHLHSNGTLWKSQQMRNKAEVGHLEEPKIKNIEAHDEKLFLFQSWNLARDL